VLLGRIEEAVEHVAIALEASGAIDPDDRPEHVPLVLLPVVAGIVAAVHGDAEAAREHAHRRTPAWLSQRVEVDVTALATLSFNRSLIEAMLDNPDAVLGEAHVSGPHDQGLFDHQADAIDVLRGWSMARLGDPSGAELAATAIERVSVSRERTLTGALQSFAGDALLAAGDPRAIELLAQAREECETRGEVWWLSEIVRLQGEADRRLADGTRAAAFLDEAERIATEQGALLVLDRIVASRALLG
jgi:hypothetical protein